jgi:superfamily II DNA or RNA helicase
MSALLAPRDYQLEAIAELHRRWDAGDTRVPMVLATGLGKTIIFAHLIADWVRTHTAKRVLVLVHTDELVQQAYKKIKDVAPGLHVGIVKAERNEVTARVIVASVQSLRSEKRRSQIRNVGMIIVDECHHATARTYRTILEHYGAFADEKKIIWVCTRCNTTLEGNPRLCPSCGYTVYGPTFPEQVQVAGFTATLARGDRQKLSDIWQECTFQRGIAFGIRRGYLLDVRGKRIVVPDLDLSTVKKSGGDYQDAALGDAMDAALAPSVIAAAYVEHAGARKGLAFWPLVATAHHGAEAFNEAGIPSAVVHGGTPREERRLILKKLHAGDIQVVHNCGVLTEGFDEPTVSCVVNARPTQSAPLYQQMVGRGLRPDLSLAPEQRGDCLVLDVVGVSRTHNLRTLIDLSPRAEEMELDEEMSLSELEDLLDAREAEDLAEARPDLEYYGEVAAEDFDPLARAGVGAWLRTDGGTYFLPVGNRAYVLIVESSEPNAFDVAWLSQSPNLPIDGKQGDFTEHTGLSLEMACSWAEEVLEELGGPKAEQRGVQGGWRNRPASIPQQKVMLRLGIELRRGMKFGQANDAIDVHLGSRRIDPVVQFLMMTREGVDDA